MKRLFTLAVITMIATLTFAQAPTQKMKASDRKIEKVASTAQMQKGMEAKAAFLAKEKAAQETSSSVLRKAAHHPTAAMSQQMNTQQMLPNVKVNRQAPVSSPAKLNQIIPTGFMTPNRAKSAQPKNGITKAEGEYQEVIAQTYSAQYFEEDGDWACVLHNGSYDYLFDIVTNDPTPLADGTYTLDQMDQNYTCIAVMGVYVYDHFIDATFTISNGGKQVDAYVTTGNTNEKFHISYTEPEVPEITSEETWTFSQSESQTVDFIDDRGLLQLVGDNGDQFVSVIVYTDQPTGTFTIDDAYEVGKYTILYESIDDHVGVKCYDLNATVTESGANIDYYGYNGVLYHITLTFTEGGGAPDVTITRDEHGIITSVAGGEEKIFQRSASGTVYYLSGYNAAMAPQSGSVTVIDGGNKVYIKDPISRFTHNTWVEGTKNGNMIVVPTAQPLFYGAQYDATVSARYGVISPEGDLNAAYDYAENIVYLVDGDTWTLQNTAAFGTVDGDAYFIGAFWDDDDTFAFGEAATILLGSSSEDSPSTELVVLPAGAEVQPWTMKATSVSSSSSTPITNQTVNVAFVGNDVYLQGVFDAFPTAWIKGTKNGSNVFFNKFQYVGDYSSINIYFTGTDGNNITDATATLAADGKTITFNTSILANGATDRIYYLTWLDNAVISATADEPVDEPVITDLTATLPYTNSFDTDTEAAEVAIYDANSDGKTWTITNDTKTGSQAVRYNYSSSKAANDYVVFPGLALEAGKSYKVAVDVRSQSQYYPERIEVVAGTEAKVSKLSSVIIPVTERTNIDYETMVADFTPDADGTYYFALHAISDKDQYYLYADNFSVKEDNPNAPKAATDFTAVAGAEGALTADLTFTLPTTTVGGNALGSVEYSISRDGVEVIQGVAQAGETKTKRDTEAHNGVNNYTLVVKANGYISEVVSTSVFVGEDTPKDVVNLKAADHNTTVGLSWTAPTEGKNGGYINPETLTYNVYSAEMIDLFGMQFPEIDFTNPYATGLTETQAEVEYDTNVGEQAYTYFGVTAENAGGESNGMMTAVLTGTPYEIPFHEEFPNGNLSYWWGADYDDAIYDANGGLGTTQDGEVVFQAPVEGWITLQSGKIALNNAENPVLSFDYKADAACSLNVKVITPEGEEIIGLMPVDNTDWATATIALDFYADQPWVRFTLTGEFDATNALYVDNVNVINAVPTDLEVKVSAPKTVVAGATAVVKAIVSNKGMEEAANYDVKFFVNDVEAATPLFEVEPLAFFQSATYEYELATSIFDELGDVTVKAVVTIDGDAVEANNADEAVVEVVAPSATPVSSVNAEQTAEGVVVDWTIASDISQEVTENFEDYEVGIYTNAMGPWTGIDGDHGMGYGWQSTTIAWPYTGEAYAFAIMNFTQVFGTATDIEATSGEQALMFMSVTNETGSGKQNDDWFISPELPGVAQTIEFMARPMTANYGAEVIEVMASSTDQSPASFTKVATFNLLDEEFVECTANLPEGTKYFALHYVSNDIFAAFVDDLKYTAGGGTPTGFNVYVDENLVATTDAETMSYTYTDELSEGSHDFAVTAVYGSAESAPVTATLNITTGISEVSTNADVEIYTVDGIRMNNVKNLKSGVYVVNGKKVIR